MSLLNVMAEKGLLVRKPGGRAFRYAAKADRTKTLGRMVSDLCHRAFEGSTSVLVTRLLEEAKPTKAELDQIREVIESYQRGEED